MAFGYVGPMAETQPLTSSPPHHRAGPFLHSASASAVDAASASAVDAPDQTATSAIGHCVPPNPPTLTCAGEIQWWPAGGPAQVCRVLEKFGLGMYAAEFEEQGYDDVEFLFKMSPSNIREMLKHVKMKKHHRNMYRAAHTVWKHSYSPATLQEERLPRRSARIAAQEVRIVAVRCR